MSLRTFYSGKELSFPALPSHPDFSFKWDQDGAPNSSRSLWEKHSPTFQEILGNFGQFLPRETETPTPVQIKNPVDIKALFSIDVPGFRGLK